MSAEKDLQALELRRAGAPIPRIMDVVGFKTRSGCENAIERAMRAQGVVTDPIALRQLELDRLDRLHFGVWTKAVGGDPAAVDRVLAITEMRLRITGIIEAGLTPLTSAYDQTIDSLELKDIDQALVALGRRYCEQVDAASGLGDPTSVTKALHLIPHVVNVLRELGATPAVRGAVTARAPKPPESTGSTTGGAKVTGIAQFMDQHGMKA